MFLRNVRAGRTTTRLGLEALEGRTLPSAVLPAPKPNAAPVVAHHPAPAPIQIHYAPVATKPVGHTLDETGPMTFNSLGPAAIPAGGTGVSLISVGPSMTVSHLQVKLNITYPQDSDLIIHLQSPAGTDVLLTRYAGGAGQGFRNTVFDDRASTWVVLGQAPFTGTYQPMVPLSSFNGQNAHGLWKLWVEAPGGKFTGTITSWSLTVN
jgi:subtilisin-like proprotein convertase family protein